MVNRGVYVKDGDKVAHVGLEFGARRNNDAIDGQEEGEYRTIRFLDVDANEWDAAVAEKILLANVMESLLKLMDSGHVKQMMANFMI